MNNISVTELKKIVDSQPGNWVVIDVRDPDEFASYRIAGSQNIPLGEIPLRLNEIQSFDRVYVQCASGVRSQRACELMNKAGVENCYNVEGGIMSWMAENFPIIAG